MNKPTEAVSPSPRSDIDTLKLLMRDFADKRDWNQFHSPKNLAMALSVEVAEQTANTGTNVQIGTRHERPAFGTELDDSIGIILNIPFGGSNHRETLISTAARVASTARANRNRQIRELTLALHEAAHGLHVVHENLETAVERLDLAERHEAMGESAYEKGEIELMDLLRMQATTIDARRQATRLQIEQNRQTALYNQAVGESP